MEAFDLCSVVLFFIGIYPGLEKILLCIWVQACIQFEGEKGIFTSDGSCIYQGGSVDSRPNCFTGAFD